MKIEEINSLIHRIDDEERILNYKLSNGICFWLIVRYEIFTALLRETIDPATLYSEKSNGLAGKLKNKLSYLHYRQKIKRRNPLHIKKHYDCLNICSSVGTVASNSGFKSRISGILADTNELSTLQLIVSNNRQYHARYDGEFCFFDALLTAKFTQAKTDEPLPDHKHLQEINGFIELLQTYLKGHLSTEYWSSIFRNLQSCCTKVIHLERTFVQLLDQTTPKIIFIEDGNYGNLAYSTLIKIAKQKKIATAEFQHGVFDIAFQYSNKIISNPVFACHKTDYVLTYGAYFSKFIQSSSINIQIGSYFMERKKNKIEYARSDTKVMIFITQKAYTDKIIPVLYSALSSLSQPFKLIIRLHPSDDKERAKYEIFDRFRNTSYSTREDIYSQIASADYVIGSFSTLLFEAIYFNKMPLIYKNDLSDYYIPEEIGKRFQNAGELQKMLEVSPCDNFETKDNGLYWSSNCQEKFSKFIEGLKLLVDNCLLSPTN